MCACASTSVGVSTAPLHLSFPLAQPTILKTWPHCAVHKHVCAPVPTGSSSGRRIHTHTHPYSRETQCIRSASRVESAHDHTHTNSIRSEHTHPPSPGSGSAHTQTPLSQMHTDLHIRPKTPQSLSATHNLFEAHTPLQSSSWPARTRRCTHNLEPVFY